MRYVSCVVMLVALLTMSVSASWALGHAPTIHQGVVQASWTTSVVAKQVRPPEGNGNNAVSVPAMLEALGAGLFSLALWRRWKRRG